MYKEENSSEMPMKQELKQSGNRHAKRLIKKLAFLDLPEVVFDSIHKEMEYATMDGYRITMKNNRNGENNEEANGNY